MTAKDDENIPDYINQMKSLVDQINAMNTHFKVSDITYAGVLAQSLPESWDAVVDDLLWKANTADTDDFSIVHFQRDIKDEYY